MARRQPVYTARMKRDSDGATDAKYKKTTTRTQEDERQTKKPAAKKVSEPVKKPAAKKVSEPEKKPAAKRAAEPVKKPAAKKVSESVKKPAARKAAVRPEAQETKPVRARRKAEPMTRREVKAKEKAQLAAYERRQALSRGCGLGTFLITMLTVVFDVLGLFLCALRGDVVDMRALSLILLMAPMAVVTTLVLPRFMPLDALLMALMNFLCGVSVVILYTVAPERGAKQAVFYAAGIAVMLVMSGVVSKLKKWRALTGLAMVLGVLALVLPLAFGEWHYGAKNWVSLPVIGSFQPSEFVKLSLVLALAYSFSAHRTIWQMMPALVFAAACLVLLMLQRDLGTALIYYITTLALFYAACGNVPLTLIGLGGGVGAAVMGYKMFAHVKVRVAMWRNPWSDALDKGYQIIQALLAIGSGGLFGVGLGQGTPEKIPAYWNDFIFAVICEQLGMVFGVCVIAVYVLLIVRSVSVCMRSRRSFDLLLGGGVAAMLGIQTFMIVAGVIKMIPLTGVTMPFLSYGGSSLISCMAMMGIVHGIYARAQNELEEDILGIK